jgi:hypothetical protein
MEPESTTPKIALLLSRLQTLNLEVTRNINKIITRLDHLNQETITLTPANHNIVDRTLEKERHQKSYKVELKQIIDTAIEYECLR